MSVGGYVRVQTKQKNQNSGVKDQSLLGPIFGCNVRIKSLYCIPRLSFSGARMQLYVHGIYLFCNEADTLTALSKGSAWLIHLTCVSPGLLQMSATAQEGLGQRRESC